jgi:hypothetical protein|tara:strand:- start:99 stop:998 length:900 start_codon:yes stop_codon:yes gene_type:complete
MELTKSQVRMVLGVFPTGSRITDWNHFQREYLPAPIRVTVRTPAGKIQSVVIRLARHGSVEDEARLLGVLAKLGLPVPELLSSPVIDPEISSHPVIALYSLLPGINLQKLSERSAKDCRLAARLVVHATTRLAELTGSLRTCRETDFLPLFSLTDELNQIVSAGGPWLHMKIFLEAVSTLKPMLAEESEDPVFTGGDNQPGNFMTDGKKVTGYLDFEMAGYRDFLFGFAKYPIYDLHPLNRAGMIHTLLAETGYSVREFQIRLALGCLSTLQREISTNGPDSKYRNHVIGLLSHSLNSL